MEKIHNTITVSFKKDEVQYLHTFKSMYAVPTAIIKDFIINTVKDNDNNTIKTSVSGQISYEDENKSQIAQSSINNLDLLDF